MGKAGIPLIHCYGFLIELAEINNIPLRTHIGVVEGNLYI